MIDLALCKVCRKVNGTRGLAESHAARLLSAGICSTCDHWIELWQSRDNDNVARINGEHYMFGNHVQDARITQDTTLEMLADTLPKNGTLGMGGQATIIRFNDGRVVITNDLWHQGTIPTQFENVLTNNAEMVSL